MRVELTTISVLHWGRLLDGESFATSRYAQWAAIMKRTFGVDVLRYSSCERKMCVLSTNSDAMTVRRILDHLMLPSVPRTAAPALDRTWQQTPLAFDVA
ncbi:hypothetical protein [Sorangium sp. So ce131]|uniref:hypothetical protein n=1 Tax=Sorangium sp. So ce131 TaxID=3133282 RepID=UPI003F60972E